MYTKWKLKNFATAMCVCPWFVTFGSLHNIITFLFFTLKLAFSLNALVQFLFEVLEGWGLSPLSGGVGFKAALGRQVLNSVLVLGNLHGEIWHYLTDDCYAVDKHAPGERRYFFQNLIKTWPVWVLTYVA